MNDKKDKLVETCCKKVTDGLFSWLVNGLEASEKYPLSLKYFRGPLLARPESGL
jgi:hypothetical protein